EADTNRSRVVRIAGFTFRRHSGALKPNGFIKYVGLSQVRVDHNTFDVAGGGLSMGSVRFFYATGVFDHNVSNSQVYVDFSGGLWRIEATGDQGWTEPTVFGGANFFFVEDNDFASLASGRIQTIADCTHAGRVVVRYNRGNDTQQHGTYGGTGRARGCRAMEVYGNTFNGGNFNAVFLNSGTTLVWGNTQTQPTGGNYCCFITLHSPRSNNKSTTWNTPTPNGWGYCGTAFSGTGSHWDGNTDASRGYPCLDQAGRGQGELLADQFSNTRNATTGCDSSRPCAWPRQALEPVYEWLNTTPFSAFAVYEPQVLQENRDYYVYTTSFTGASGVGS